MNADLLQGKSAIITGGTRGIGKAIAKCFVQAGAHVAIFGTNRERGEETLAELKNLGKGGEKSLFLQVDVKDGKQVEEAVAHTHQTFGAIDILVNNAGITKDNLLLRLSEADWQAVLDTNLKSVYHMCRSAVRYMLKARKGKIINITSVVALMGNPGQTNYAASKAGMIGFTKSLAAEIASRQICVNCIAPGFIQTEMTDALTETQKEALLQRIPLGRFGQGENVAHAALFLASPLSDYITGQVLVVDGGMA